MTTWKSDCTVFFNTIYAAIWHSIFCSLQSNSGPCPTNGTEPIIMWRWHGSVSEMPYLCFLPECSDATARWIIQVSFHVICFHSDCPSWPHGYLFPASWTKTNRGLRSHQPKLEECCMLRMWWWVRLSPSLMFNLLFGRALATGQSVQIHPSSVLFRTKPDCVIFNELVRTTQNYVKNLTRIDPLWLAELAPQYYATEEELWSVDIAHSNILWYVNYLYLCNSLLY